MLTMLRRCCRTLTVEDLHHESKRLDERYEQALPLLYHKQVQLKSH